MDTLLQYLDLTKNPYKPEKGDRNITRKQYNLEFILNFNFEFCHENFKAIIRINFNNEFPKAF